MSYCTNCGGPCDAPETHHRNEQRGDNTPDNLSPVGRRCHMEHHDNERAVDDLAEQRYGPKHPNTGPPAP